MTQGSSVVPTKLSSEVLKDNASRNEQQGYELRSARSLPYIEDLGDENAKNRKVDGQMLKDIGHTSKPLLVCAAFFVIAFLILLIWLVLISKCVVRGLCDTTDQSSQKREEYFAVNQPFLVPTVFLWASLTTACLGLAAASVYGIFYLRRAVGSARMAQTSMVMKLTVTCFPTWLLRVILFPTLVLFIVVGLYINWKVAAAFWTGAGLASLVIVALIQISVRSNARVAAAANVGVKYGLQVMFQSASMQLLFLFCAALAGISIIYLTFEDVRTLVGCLAGVVFTASCLSLSATVLGSTSNAGIELLRRIESYFSEQSLRNSAVVLRSVSTTLGRVLSLKVDLFTSYIASITATAVLGSLLPFSYRDPFSLCVFNHLYVDDACGPFGYPKQLSYATYICANDNLYLEYPTLSAWESNAAFVAMPFLIALISVFVGLASSIILCSGRRTASEPEGTIPNPMIRRKVNLATAVSFAIMLSGAAALCWGLFGPHSSFMKTPGFGNKKELPLFGLASKIDACTPQYDETIEQPLPLPQGSIGSEQYRPLSNLGFTYGAVDQTAWRLYLCIVIGFIYGFMLSNNTLLSLCPRKERNQKVLDSQNFGISLGILHSIGVCMSSTLVGIVLVFLALLGAYKVYGFFGIGLTAVSCLSTVFATVASGLCSSLAVEAETVGKMAGLSQKFDRRVSELLFGSYSALNTAKIYVSGCSMLSMYALIGVVVHMSGLVPAPSELVGSPTDAPRRMITDAKLVSLLNLYTVSGSLFGVLVPFISGVLAASNHRRLLTLFVCKLRGFFVVGKEERIELKRRGSIESMGVMTRAALVESASLLLFGIISPLVIGFAFGRQALIAMLVASLATSHMITILASTIGNNICDAHNVIRSKGIEGMNIKGWDIASQVGDPLKDMLGPCLDSLTKLMTVTGLVFIGRMRTDLSIGWISAVLLVITFIILILLTFWSRRIRKNAQQELEELKKNGQLDIPRRELSPFYEAGPTIDQKFVAPGSQAAKALKAIGSPTRPIDPRKVPGLSNNQQGEFKEVSLT